MNDKPWMIPLINRHNEYQRKVMKAKIHRAIETWSSNRFEIIEYKRVILSMKNI